MSNARSPWQGELIAAWDRLQGMWISGRLSQKQTGGGLIVQAAAWLGGGYRVFQRAT
jgi:hypothetical protein